MENATFGDRQTTSSAYHSVLGIAVDKAEKTAEEMNLVIRHFSNKMLRKRPLVLGFAG